MKVQIGTIASTLSSSHRHMLYAVSLRHRDVVHSGRGLVAGDRIDRP
ncbi:MAG: hypothetical protein WCB57_08030 [Pseudonocardiaceae bacterium]